MHRRLSLAPSLVVLAGCGVIPGLDLLAPKSDLTPPEVDCFDVEEVEVAVDVSAGAPVFTWEGPEAFSLMVADDAAFAGGDVTTYWSISYWNGEQEEIPGGTQEIALHGEEWQQIGPPVTYGVEPTTVDEGFTLNEPVGPVALTPGVPYDVQLMFACSRSGNLDFTYGYGSFTAR